MNIKPINMGEFVEVHKQIGLALWHCQAFEDTLVHFIAMVLKMPPSRAESEAMKVLEDLQSKMLGGLIAELRKANSTNSVSEFERRVNAFLRERNWLVHKSWREHHTDVFNPGRLPALFGRLTALADEALSLQKHFGKLIEAWVPHQPDVTPEKLELAFQEKLKERGLI